MPTKFKLEALVEKHASMAFAKKKGHVRPPRQIAYEEWAAMPAEQRAPERGLAMLDMRGDQTICLIVDAREHQPVWLFVAESARLAELIRQINESGDGTTGTVVGGGLIVCPPYCPISGVDSKPGGPGGGGGGTEPLPHLLMVRAKLIERALSASHVKVSEGAGTEELEALILRD